MIMHLHSRTSRWAAGATIGVFLAGIALELSDANSSQSGSALGDAILDVAGLLDERSPGERTQAALVKSKQGARVAGPRAIPEETERVLGKVFPAEVDDHLLHIPGGLLGQTYPAGLADVPMLADAGELPMIFAMGPVFAGGGGSAPGSMPGIGGGGGAGGGGGGGGIGQLPAPPVQVPSVPEPSTWVMMLMGAALCGASMRRQRRLQLQVAV